MKKDAYDSLKTNSTIDWLFYDRWKTNSDGNFSWQRDQLVDMIYMVFRSRQSGNITNGLGGFASGIAALGACFGTVNGNYTVLANTTDTVKINDSYSSSGSGHKTDAHSTNRYSRMYFMDISTHEHGHYILGGGHHIYSKVVSGPHADYSFNPWEMVKAGYITQKFVSYGSYPNNLTLGEFSSRTGNAGETGEIMQIPISANGSEFFLIANRRKMGANDRPMGGDTLADDLYQFTKNVQPDLAKGIYIYHITGGYESPSGDDKEIDLECADGLWDWKQEGVSNPIWSSSSFHPVFVRDKPSYLNDLPNVVTNLGKDGRSLIMTGIVNGSNITMQSWYSRGKSHNVSTYTSGTDRLHTNSNEPWFSLEVNGDRWDAWNLGYNEIFSPWSSPNTKDWYNNQTGIYIWYKLLNSSSNDASFEFYKVGENGTEEQILQWTPPSKPMMLEIESYWNGTTCNPKIVWRQNMEPDMVNTDEHSEMSWKRYKIYKSGNLNGLNYLPPDQMFYPEQKYQHVATVDFNPSTTDAFWIDPNVNLYDCSEAGETPGIPYPVRYRIQAVDKYNTSSVLSDFGSAVGVKDGSGEPVGDPEENPILNTGTNQTVIPDKYILKQNYPNPFNPTTNIQYELPVGNFVVLKVYDINGREIKTLINEFKPAGRYLFSFNASDLSSGIYIYKIISGNFNETKRMVLIK